MTQIVKLIFKGYQLNPNLKRHTGGLLLGLPRRPTWNWAHHHSALARLTDGAFRARARMRTRAGGPRPGARRVVTVGQPV